MAARIRADESMRRALRGAEKLIGCTRRPDVGVAPAPRRARQAARRGAATLYRSEPRRAGSAPGLNHDRTWLVVKLRRLCAGLRRCAAPRRGLNQGKSGWLQGLRRSAPGLRHIMASLRWQGARMNADRKSRHGSSALGTGVALRPRGPSAHAAGPLLLAEQQTRGAHNWRAAPCG